MNKSAKIILLVVAILIAVGGVMAFYKTIVSPPRDLKFNNQYVTSVKKDISRVKAVQTDYSIDSIYTVVTHEINFQWRNSLLSSKERDELLESFVNQYVPVYVTSCKAKFQQSVWNENDLKEIQGHVADLHALQTSDGSRIIGNEVNTSLNEISNVIVRYYEAKSTAVVRGYNGLQYAKQKIATARNYAKIEPINNCQELVNRLNTVATRLNLVHVEYLSSQVGRMKNWDLYSESEYDNLAVEVSNKLREYKRYAHSTYGTSTDISYLETRAGEYYKRTSFE